MRNRSFLFLVNPAAGGIDAGSCVSRIRKRLKTEHCSYQVRVTSEPGEATRLARNATSHGFSHVVSVGGDGTTHEIVNGLMSSSAALGLLPVGNGNDFSKALKVPDGFDSAFDVLLRGEERAVDVGRIEDRYFINGAGIGMDGAVAHRFQRRERLTGYSGYAIAALWELLSFRGFVITVDLSGYKFRGTALFVSVSNGPVQGGGFRMAPDASVFDGRLDVQVTRDLSTFRRVFHFPRWMFGSQSRLPEVELKRTPSLSVTLNSSVPVHVDGEVHSLESGMHEIDVQEGGIDVICP